MRIITAVLLLAAAPVIAAFPASAQDVTATCKDGTTFTGTSHRGACSRHGGVQSFSAPATQPAAATPAAVPTATVTAPSTQTPPPAASPVPIPAAAVGGAGQVWVNTATHVYHCQGTRYFGKTKAGKYLPEAAAKTEGDRPDHGKTCS